jgi:hypothetical protein
MLAYIVKNAMRLDVFENRSYGVKAKVNSLEAEATATKFYPRDGLGDCIPTCHSW